MIRWLKYRIRLAKLSRDVDGAAHAIDLNYQARLKEGMPRSEAEGRRDSDYSEVQMIEEEIDALQSQWLVRKALSYQIPLPPHSDKELWERGRYLGSRYLTPKGYSQLRSAVRTEQKEQQDMILRWIPPLVGLLGIITGLVAVAKTRLEQ